MPETSIPPPAAVARPSKPVSETLLNEKVGCPCVTPARRRSGLEKLFALEYRWERANVNHSGIAASPPSSSALLSVSPSASSSQYSFSSGELGLLLSVWVSVLVELMRSAMAAF